MRTQIGVERRCFECGQLCHLCRQLTERRCNTCHEQYCAEHDSGCNFKNVSINLISVSSSAWLIVFESVHGAPLVAEELLCWITRGSRRYIHCPTTRIPTKGFLYVPCYLVIDFINCGPRANLDASSARERLLPSIKAKRGTNKDAEAYGGSKKQDLLNFDLMSGDDVIVLFDKDPFTFMVMNESGSALTIALWLSVLVRRMANNNFLSPSLPCSVRAFYARLIPQSAFTTPLCYVRASTASPWVRLGIYRPLKHPSCHTCHPLQPSRSVFPPYLAIALGIERNEGRI